MVELETVERLASYGGSVFKNIVVNPGFDIWQRGTPRVTASTNRYTRYSADKWEAYRGGWAAGQTVSQQTGIGVPGCTYCGRIQRDSGNAATNVMYIANTIPTRDVTNCWGQYLTLSFYARCGANFSASNSTLAAALLSGTSSNQAPSNGFTGQADVINQNCTLTTSWQRFTFTSSAVLATTVNELGVIFTYTPVGTASTNDYFEITGVQVNVGRTALPFSPRPWDIELQICQAYFEKSYDYGTVAGTATEVGCVHRVAYTSYWLFASDVQFKVKKYNAPYVVPFNTYNGTSNQTTECNTGDSRVADRAVSSMDVGCSSFSIIGSNSFTPNNLERYQWVACSEDTA